MNIMKKFIAILFVAILGISLQACKTFKVNKSSSRNAKGDFYRVYYAGEKMMVAKTYKGTGIEYCVTGGSDVTCKDLKLTIITEE